MKPKTTTTTWPARVIAYTTLVAVLPGCQPEFLREADFEGHAVAPASPVTTGGLQSTYNGIMTFANVDRTTVSQLLPENFQLAPRKTTRLSNLHPIVLMFGDPTDGAFVMSPTTIQSTGIHYSEMILAVPFVQKRNQSGGWHTYIIRMYLDNPAAVAGGFPYGYQKVLASIEWKGRYARAWDTLAGDYLEGDFRWGARWYDGNDALNKIPNFQDMVNIMTTEILGRNGLISICSHFEWNLDEAKVAKAYTSYTMKSPFRADMGAWPGLSPFENVRNGAVVMRGLRWRLKPVPPFNACSF